MTLQKPQFETVSVPDQDTASPQASDRFERRRADILAAAIPVLNGHGFKGMRLTVVAELIGLRATGVTYYFPRKEELAVACIESGYAILNELLAEAEKQDGSAARVSRLIELFVARDAAVRRGEAMPLASFAAIPALEGEHFERVADGYKRLFRRVRNLMGEGPGSGHIDTGGAASGGLGIDKTDRTIRALILLEQLFWAATWLGDFDLEDYPRLAERITDIALNGVSISALAAPLQTIGLDAQGGEIDAGNASFLRAATLQINAHGYRGASVDRISAALNVTKGAFYHHNEAKDDLVAACFRRSFGVIRDAQLRVRALKDTEARRLASAVEALIRFQLGPEGPLLRTSVLSSMPPEHKAEILSRSYRISRQFASMIADSIADGSGRSIDPSVAGAMVHAAINIASDARSHHIASDPDIVARFVRAIFAGVLAE